MDRLVWNWDDRLKEYVNELTESADNILIGRKMTEGFIPYRNIDQRSIIDHDYPSLISPLHSFFTRIIYSMGDIIKDPSVIVSKLKLTMSGIGDLLGRILLLSLNRVMLI